LTLVEALIALAIAGVAIVAILPAFMKQVQANTLSEERTGAITAVEQRLEALRLADPASLPTSGATAPQNVTVGTRRYQVVTRYCVRPQYCDAGSRHVVVEAYWQGRKVYDAETVFTQLL
jgi:type II secretory pathway pseudopilin PulG